MLLLWVIPFLLFFYLIDYVSYFHFIPLLPLWAIAGAKWITDLTTFVAKRGRKFGKALPYIIISEIGIFGLATSIMLVATNASYTQFETIAFIAEYLPETAGDVSDRNRVTVVGEITYEWIPRDLLNKNHDYRSLWSERPYGTQKFLMVVDDRLRDNINNVPDNDERLSILYNKTRSIAQFNSETLFPNNFYIEESIHKNTLLVPIEIRANY